MELWQSINDAADGDARAALLSCCGSTRWVDGMMARRPFASRDAALDAAKKVWEQLSPEDWLEAFGHHPRIGDREALRARFPQTAHLSEREQSGVAGASDAVLDDLAEGNWRYEQKFGHIFIVCATGLTADEMLARLRARLPNDAATELRMAAQEQGKITALRLQRRG